MNDRLSNKHKLQACTLVATSTHDLATACMTSLLVHVTH